MLFPRVFLVVLFLLFFGGGGVLVFCCVCCCYSCVVQVLQPCHITRSAPAPILLPLPVVVVSGSTGLLDMCTVSDDRVTVAAP